MGLSFACGTAGWHPGNLDRHQQPHRRVQNVRFIAVAGRV
jgi:hypothetical protein